MGLVEIFGILLLLMIIAFSITMSIMKDDQVDLDKIREPADVDDVEMTSHLFPEEKVDE